MRKRKMAYGNYGGECHVDGENVTGTNCDVSLNELLGVKDRVNYWSHFGQDIEKFDRMSHCWVGDKDSGYIIKLYKSGVYCYYKMNQEGVQEIENNALYNDDSWSYEDQELELDGGVNVKIEYRSMPERVIVYMKDIKGRQWNGYSGYGIGQGYDC
jgi:hypothetical protein